LLRNRIAGGDTKTTRKAVDAARSIPVGRTATRTIRLFSSILSYAVDMELIPRNPALGIKLPPGGQRHRYLSADELRRLGEVLERPASTTTAGAAAIILRLLILTGARRGEIEGLKWSEVDFNFGMLRKKTSKTGAKVIPLARVAVEILEEQRRWVDRSQPWVFPAYRGDGHFDGLNKEWHRIRKLAGIEDVRIHDLRHTFASVGAGGGVGLPLIGGILGHRKHRRRNAMLLADGPLRTAADLIGSELAAARWSWLWSSEFETVTAAVDRCDSSKSSPRSLRWQFRRATSECSLGQSLSDSSIYAGYSLLYDGSIIGYSLLTIGVYIDYSLSYEIGSGPN
jgi:integrase